MVALRTERHVFLWRVRPRPNPSRAPKNVSMQEILDILEAAYDAGTARMYFSEVSDEEDKKDEKNQLYIADFKRHEDKGRVTLLLNRGDPHQADAAYLEPPTNKVRVARPSKTESTGHSAHLVIETKRRPGESFYRASVERMTGVSSSNISRLLNGILKDTAKGTEKYTYEKKEGSGKKGKIVRKPYSPMLEIGKAASASLREDLEKGTLLGINLIKRSDDFAGLDAPDVVKSVTQKIEIRTKDIEISKFEEVLRAVGKKGREQGYHEIQVEFERASEAGRSAPRFDLDKEDAIDTLFVRSEVLKGFSKILESCYKDIYPEIEEKIVEIINNSKGWQ